MLSKTLQRNKQTEPVTIPKKWYF